MAETKNHTSNKTRFYVLSVDLPATAKAERRDLILIAIHDWLLKTELGQYFYLVECTNGTYEGYLKLTEKSDFEFRYLGSFDVA